MPSFSARGFTVATAATADHCLFQLWNPDSLKRIRAFELGVTKAGAGAANDSIYVCRTTARGTAGSTITPDADNAWEGDDVPSSGALLDLAAFSGQPTRGSPNLWGFVAAAVAGSGTFWQMRGSGIAIPPGTGLAVCQRAATVWPTSEVYFCWDE